MNTLTEILDISKKRAAEIASQKKFSTKDLDELNIVTKFIFAIEDHQRSYMKKGRSGKNGLESG